MSLNEELTERARNRNNILQLLQQYSDILEEKLGKTTLILFGSYARGDFNLWSDVDFIIISDHFKNIRFIDRPYKLPELYHDISYADAICWTPDEAKKCCKKIHGSLH